MRDDFTQQTKNQLASRVGWKCSNPNCRKATIGAGKGTEGIIKIGVAAHICAASEGGPRYNINMTSDERKSYNNGIWLCQSCAKLIDSDTNRYTIALLNKWKQEAERLSVQELESCDKLDRFDVINSNNEVSSTVLEVHIDLDGVINEINVGIYNKLLTWLMNREKEIIKIDIVDERISLCQNRIDSLSNKMANEILSVEEEKWYKINVKVIEILEREKKYKEIAIKYFMQDESFFAYSNCDNVERLWEIIIRILNNTIKIDYDHTIQTLLDCYLYKNLKRDIEKDYHFVVAVTTEELKEVVFKNYGKNFPLQFINDDVASLGHKIVTHIIAPRFYFFLAETYIYGNKELLNNSYFLDLLNYRIGLH